VKLFYVVSIDALRMATFGYRALDLSNGNLLVSVEWSNEMAELQWAKTPGVIPLPHPFFEQAVPLSDEHLTHLSFHFGVEKGHTIHDLLREVVKIEPLMRVWAK
jgi:hypothetical protein